MVEAHRPGPDPQENCIQEPPKKIMGYEFCDEKYRKDKNFWTLILCITHANWARELGHIHGLDMAYISGEGTVADESVVVLIRMWDWESWNISTWVAQIPVLFVQLLSNFMKGLHCHTHINTISFFFFLRSWKFKLGNKNKLEGPIPSSAGRVIACASNVTCAMQKTTMKKMTMSIVLLL